MADVDFATCERPDALIQLAWDAGLDRKAVIREGVDAAGLLRASERTEFVTLFWPVPHPLEAVDRWSENPHAITQVPEQLRPFASAVIPGCVVGALVGQLAVVPRVSPGLASTALVVCIVAANMVLGALFKALIAATLRRRLARLDEAAALAIVLAALRRGARQTPARVPRACEWIRAGLARLGGEPPAPDAR